MLQVGRPVTGNNLIGRNSEINLVKELLKAGQNFVIIAPRRMGKTSIVLEILQQLKNEGFYTCYTDIFSVSNIPVLASRITEAVLSNKKLDKLFKKAIKDISEIFQNIEFRQEVEDFRFILNFNNKAAENQWELLENSIDFIEDYSVKNKKRTIMAFDEFGDIKKLDGTEIVKLFRSKIQLHQSVSYIFSGSYESVMNELFIEKNAPFFRMARIVNLGNISESDFTAYLSKLFKKENIAISEKRLNQITDFTKGHPYYTQLYAQELIIRNKLSRQANLLSHNQILEHLLIAEKNYLEKLWDELSASKELKKILIALAKGTKSLYSELNDREVNIPRGIKKLKGMGVILKQNNKHVFSDPLLQLWINKNIT